MANKKRPSPHQDTSSPIATIPKSNKRSKASHQKPAAAKPRKDLTRAEQNALLSFLRRLPIEIRREIYRHSLTAQYSIQIAPNKRQAGPSQNFPYVFQKRLLHSAPKKSGEPRLDPQLNKELRRSLSFYFTSYQNSLSHEAHAYFLENNTIVVRQQYQIQSLIQFLRRL